MRSRDIRFRPPTTNPNYRRYFLIPVAITQRDRSVKPKFDLEAHRIRATSWFNQRVDRHGLPSENYAILILDHVNIVPVACASVEIVP